ncbi:hypothetical protein C8R43DRAFT_964326 [Mycena crocata]|nr:hypothetical protein C8R43DRAFT_964326 [Mycena crocata]
MSLISLEMSDSYKFYCKHGCGKGNNRLSNIHKHEALDHVPCGEYGCEKAFYNREWLKKHMDDVHGKGTGSSGMGSAGQGGQVTNAESHLGASYPTPSASPRGKIHPTGSNRSHGFAPQHPHNPAVTPPGHSQAMQHHGRNPSNIPPYDGGPYAYPPPAPVSAHAYSGQNYSSYPSNVPQTYTFSQTPIANAYPASYPPSNTYTASYSPSTNWNAAHASNHASTSTAYGPQLPPNPGMQQNLAPQTPWSVGSQYELDPRLNPPSGMNKELTQDEIDDIMSGQWK